LMLASNYGRTDIVVALLQAGANIHSSDDVSHFTFKSINIS